MSKKAVKARWYQTARGWIVFEALGGAKRAIRRGYKSPYYRLRYASALREMTDRFSPGVFAGRYGVRSEDVYLAAAGPFRWTAAGQRDPRET